MSLTDRAADRLSARWLSLAIPAVAFVSIAAFLLSLYSVSTRAGAARDQAQQAIREARSSSEQSTQRLASAICGIADAQRVHLDDPGEARPSTPRGVQSAGSWQLLWESYGCVDWQPTSTPSLQPSPSPS